MTLSFSDQSGLGNLFVGGSNFRGLYSTLAASLLETEPFNAGKWQALDISQSSAHKTYELLNTTLWLDIPQDQHHTEQAVEPDMPWAEGHFQERVAGDPVNPGEWHDKWPYHLNSESLHQRDTDKRYDHNYMERFWATGLSYESFTYKGYAFSGYRFDVGDLEDVVNLLREDPLTRQAFLPIWFPEDTGATSNQRVPCTLGYHFIVRNHTLHVVYYLRSCEIYRHFKNDVYMAMRLGQWMRDNIKAFNEGPYKMGSLTMHITSLHGFVGDTPHIEEIAQLSD